MLALVVVGAYVLTLIWVGLDASERDFSQCENWYWRSTFGWVVACMLLWIAYFPLYLSARRNVPRKRPGAAVSGSSTVDQLSKLAELRDSGALTQDEFDAQKATIIQRDSEAAPG